MLFKSYIDFLFTFKKEREYIPVLNIIKYNYSAVG